MSTFPTIQIQQQYAKIGLDIQRSKLEIRQHPSTIEIETRPLQIEMRAQPGELLIDQSRAFDALGMGSHVTFMERVVSEASQAALEGIARVVEKGNRMAAIQHHQNVIADVAAEQAFAGGTMNYLGEASYDNVDIQYIAHSVEYNVDPGDVQIDIQAHKPEIKYTPGNVEVYNMQYSKVVITPSQIDLKL